MSYIPDDGPDTGATARTFMDRLSAIGDSWPDDSLYLVDFGGWNGRFSYELFERGNINGATLIEGDYVPLARANCPSVEVVREHVTPRALGTIIRGVDHRDGGVVTVLALSVLHHLTDWKKYVGAIERNADYAFIETAHPDEVLPEAVAHDQSDAIWRWCEKRGRKVHESPGWDSRYLRPTWFMEF